MGEWERGLEAAQTNGLIDQALRDRLAALEFEREHGRQGFPMRVALYVLGAVLLVAEAFATFVRVLGDDPSELLAAAMLAVIGVVIEGVAWLIRRAKTLPFLAGIVGAFAGIPLGVALGLALPGDPNSGSVRSERSLPRCGR